MKKLYWVIGLCLCIIILCLASSCGSSNTTTSGSNLTNTTSSTPTTTTTTTSTTNTTTSSGSVSDILGRMGNKTSVSYDMTMTTQGQIIHAKVWWKNMKIREEMVMEGITTVLIMDMNAHMMYSYLPATNMATRMALNANQIPQGSPQSDNAILQYNPTIIGTETIDGKSCTIITWDVPNTSSMKEWIWTETGFPLKMEITSEGTTSTTEFSNYDFSDIPDSMFELPAGVTITDM